jgi:hypothetical protein
VGDTVLGIDLVADALVADVFVADVLVGLAALVFLAGARVTEPVFADEPFAAAGGAVDRLAGADFADDLLTVAFFFAGCRPAGFPGAFLAATFLAGAFLAGAFFVAAISGVPPGGSNAGL